MCFHSNNTTSGSDTGSSALPDAPPTGTSGTSSGSGDGGGVANNKDGDKKSLAPSQPGSASSVNNNNGRLR